MINEPNLILYANKAAQKACQSFFNPTKKQISGKEIVQFTVIEQVNFFILLFLFEKWNDNIQKSKSPYFDYESKEVKDVFSQYSSVLSNHILINQIDFEPLVSEAIQNAFIFIFLPESFIEKELKRNEGISFQNYMKDKKKYFKIYKNEISKLNDLFSSKTFDSNYLSDAFQGISQAERLKNLEAFRVLMPYEEHKVLIIEKDPYPKIEIGNAISLDLEKREKIKEEIKDELELEDLKEIKMPDLPKEETNFRNKIIDFKSAMSINQRYMFVKELFDNREEAFDAALQKVNQSKTYPEAIGNLVDSYADKYNWDTEKEEVAEFFELISRKFFMDSYN